MKWNFCTKLQLPPEPLTKGLPPPDPHSLCLLSSTEFVEPPNEKNSWVRHCMYRTTFMGSSRDFNPNFYRLFPPAICLKLTTQFNLFRFFFPDRRYGSPGNSGGIATEWNAWSSAITKVDLIFSCQQVFSAFIHSVPTTNWVSRLICLLNDFGTLPDSSRLSTPPRWALLEDKEFNEVRLICGTGNFMNICRKFDAILTVHRR